MINWDFFTPRNFVVIAALSVLAFMVYNHFAQSGDN
jgi:hypothetical protein